MNQKYTPTNLLLLFVFLIFSSYSFGFEINKVNSMSNNLIEVLDNNVPIITGYLDSTCDQDLGRTLEIYVKGSVDFTNWELQVQQNGNGFNTSISLDAFGTVSDAFIYVTNDSQTLDNEFGITSNIIETTIDANGNDAFQIVDQNDTVIDRYGHENENGNGQNWQYQNSYFYRANGAEANGGNFDTFNWLIGNANALNGEGLCNSSEAFSETVPLGTYQLDFTASAQIIHNSADPAAEFVDVYVNGEIFVEDVEFRTATSFLTFPAETSINIDITPQNSSDVSESILNVNTTLTSQEKYILVVDGVINPSQFDASVNSPIDLSVEVFSGAREEALAIAGNTDILFHNGTTDVESLDFDEVSIPVGTLVGNSSYTDFSNYIQLATSNYVIQPKISNDEIELQNYDLSLTDLNLQNKAVTLLTSGFFEPDNNQDGKGFGLWLVAPEGGDFIELPFEGECITFNAPYSENFEGEEWVPVEDFLNENDVISECWTRTPDNDGDSYAWLVSEFGTGSPDTGPSTGYDGDTYIYVESSEGNNGDQAFMALPLTNLGNLDDAAIEFYYHMYGNSMGTLSLEVKNLNDQDWTEVFSISGQQQSSSEADWIRQEVDLSNFNNQVIEIRFVATKAFNFSGDIAIDAVSINEATSCLAPSNLNVDNISDDSVQLNWSNQDSAIDGFNWFLFAENDDPNNDTPILTGSASSGETSADLSGLQPNTTYDVYVQADCGNGDESIFSIVETFTTALCSIEDQCVYTFELTDVFGDGWNDNVMSIIQDGEVIAQLGEDFDDGNAQTETVTICDISNIEIFWEAQGAFPDEVGLTITNPFDEEIYELTPDSENQRGSTIFSFTSFCTPPTCPTVENFSIENILSNSVELSWNEVDNASEGYIWYIFEEDEDPETSTPFLTGNVDFGTNQIVVDGLSESTAYDAYVEADCDNGDLSELSIPLNFNTNCTTFSAPFNENFDSSNWVIGSGDQNDDSEIDPCWTRNNESDDDGYFWGVSETGTGSAFTGPNEDYTGGNYIYSVGESGSSGDQAIITSPLIDLNGLDSPGLIFYYFMYGFGVDELRVEVRDSSSSNWVELTQIVGSQQSSVDEDWEEVVLSLGDFTDQTIQFRFIAERGISDSSDIALDQVSINEVPSCATPTDINIENIDLDNADLSWTAGDDLATGYQWQVFLQGDNPSTDTPVATGNTDANTFSANVSGLSASTEYVAYVQADCGSGEFSFLSEPELFSTLVCSADSTCDYTFVLTDSFGDGWNGNTMSVFQDGQLVQVLGEDFTGGSEQSDVLSLCDGADIELFWNAGGQYSYEVGIEILNSFDEEIYENEPNEGSQNSTLTNFTVDCLAPEGCFPPSNFAIANVESNAVELTWTDIPSAISGYDWFLFLNGDNPLQDPPVDSGSTAVGSETVTISNLSENTEYEVYIRSDCGIIAVSPISDPLYFETPCSIFSTPFEEDFDNGQWVSQSTGFQESIDGCWNRDPESDNNEYQWFTNDVEAPTETGSLEDLTGGNFLYADATFGSQGDEAYLSIPTVDLSSLSDPSITFYYFMYGETIGDLSLEVKLNSESSWTTLSTISGEQQSSKTDNWIEEIVDLNQFAGEEVDIRFKAVRGTTPNGNIQIDAVNIDELPTCLKPTNLEISNITVDSAQLSFDGDPSAINGYEWLLFLEGDDPEQDSPVATGSTANTTALLDNLTASTSYEVYVRSDCGNSEFSELSLPTSFFTDTCLEENTCDYEITLLDDFGDGWNGATMQIIQDGNVTAIIGENFDDGSMFTENVSLCDDVAIEIFWNQGGEYEDEVDIIITNPFDDVIYDSNSENISPDSTLYTFTSDCTPPLCEIPTNLVANSITQTSVELQWDVATESLETYNWSIFEAGDDPDSETPVAEGTSSGETSVDVTNLSADTAYEAYIQVECEFSTSELSPATSFTTLEICEIPINLSVDNITQTEADLSWDDTSNASDGFIWYLFNTGDDPEMDEPVQTSTTSSGETSVSISDLTADSIYDVYVVSDCGFDDSELSEVETFTTLEICEVPTNISIDNITQTEADLSWDDTSNATDGFIWYIFNTGDNPETDTPVEVGTTTFGELSASISNLTADTSYDVYLQSDCGFDDSELSSVETFTTLEICEVPTNASVENITQTEADLSWDDTSNATDGFIWYVFNAGDNPEMDAPVQFGTTTSGELSASISNLTADTSYNIYLQSDCGFDDSELSQVVTFTTWEICEVPVNLSLNNIQQNSVDLTWDDTSNASNGFTWYIFAENDDPLVDSPLESGTTAQGTTSVTINGLSEFTTYQIYVEAICANDSSDLSEAIVFTTANNCETPSNLSISNITLTEADLSWDDTSNASDGFIWYVFNAGDNPNTSTPVDTGVTSTGEVNVNIDGLNPNTNYQAYVESVCSFGNSSLSGAVSFTTLEECDAPTNLNVTNIQQTSVELNWDEDDNATDGFIWYVFNQGDDPLTDTPVESGATNSGETSVTVSNLSAGLTYQAYIEASCESGFSELSDAETFTMLSVDDAPVNDDLCDAIALGLGNSTTSDQFTNLNATTQMNEVSGTCFSSDVESSVWFRFVATSTEMVEVSLDSGGIINPRVAVYEAPNDCSDLSTLVEVSCNEDFSMSSDFEISDLTEGTTYYIQVDTETANSGDFGISVEELLSTRDFDRFNFSFYPNPVKTHLNMSASADIEKVIVYNMLGQEIQIIRPNNIQSKLNLQNLQTGKYLVKVTIDDVTEIFSILKE